MAYWESQTLYDVINDIEEEKFVLPVIQRKLVWDEEKMVLLFDTLLKGDSFGGIMVIEEEKGEEPLFNYRPFTKDGNFIPSANVTKVPQKQYFVIDGQQRLQSFYIGLKGSINGKNLYFDLYSDFSTEYEFKFESDTKQLPDKPKDNKERPISEHLWYPAKNLINRLKRTNDEDQVADEVLNDYAIDDSQKREHIKKNIKALYKNTISSKAIGFSTVYINKSLPSVANRQRIVELFKRLNDGGTRLSPFDLVASILKGYSWEMEAFLDDILVTFKDIGVSQDNLIKLIFLLQDNYSKEMASIEAKDAQFAINNKQRIKATLEALLAFLKEAKLYNYYKNPNRSFIPLFFISYHIYHRSIKANDLSSYFKDFDAGNQDFQKMKRWLYHSLLNGVFRSRGAGWIPYRTGIKKLLNEMAQHKDNAFPEKSLYDIYYNHPLTFSTNYEEETLDNLDRAFLYYIIYDHSQTIRTQDEDHIMPKSILEKMSQNPILINSIANFQLLDSGTNRWVKSGKSFIEWVNNSEHVADKDFYIRRHLIPDNNSLWIEDKFIEFITARRALIMKKIQTIFL